MAIDIHKKTRHSCFSFSNDLIIYARIIVLVNMSTIIKSFKWSKFSMAVSNFISSSDQDTIRDWHFNQVMFCNDQIHQNVTYTKLSLPYYLLLRGKKFFHNAIQNLFDIRRLSMYVSYERTSLSQNVIGM